VLLLAIPGCSTLNSPSAPPPLRVMTFNIRSGNGNLERTAETIRDLAPDIVALQEVDVHWADRSGFADQAAYLAAALRMQLRFAHIYNLAGADSAAAPREFGVALLSRYPIVEWRNDTIMRLSTQQANPLPAPMPGLLEAVLSVNGLLVRVFNTHLDYRADPAVRRHQVTEMLRYVGEARTPIILFGDLNAGPAAPELQPLFDLLCDSWDGHADSGATYPAEKPAKRIDYILVSNHFRVLSARVPATETSDHRPVVADLLPDTRNARRPLRRCEGAAAGH